MTAKELIAELTKCPPDSRVVVLGYSIAWTDGGTDLEEESEGEITGVTDLEGRVCIEARVRMDPSEEKGD